MTPPVVPRDVLNVEDLEEFELHEVVIGMSVLLRKCIGDQRLNICSLLVGQLDCGLVSHGARAQLSIGLRGERILLAPGLVIESAGLLAAILVGAEELLAFTLRHYVSGPERGGLSLL